MIFKEVSMMERVEYLKFQFQFAQKTFKVKVSPIEIKKQNFIFIPLCRYNYPKEVNNIQMLFKKFTSEDN